LKESEDTKNYREDTREIKIQWFNYDEEVVSETAGQNIRESKGFGHNLNPRANFNFLLSLNHRPRASVTSQGLRRKSHVFSSMPTERFLFCG
jgi:hypothetical protein